MKSNTYVMFVAFRKTRSGNVCSKVLPCATCLFCVYIICNANCSIGLDVYLLLKKSCSRKIETFLLSLSLSVKSSSIKWFSGQLSVHLSFSISYLLTFATIFSPFSKQYFIQRQIGPSYDFLPNGNYSFFEQRKGKWVPYTFQIQLHNWKAIHSTQSLKLFFLVFR
jgi:hypothetical protein